MQFTLFIILTIYKEPIWGNLVNDKPNVKVPKSGFTELLEISKQWPRTCAVRHRVTLSRPKWKRTELAKLLISTINNQIGKITNKYPYKEHTANRASSDFLMRLSH